MQARRTDPRDAQPRRADPREQKRERILSTAARLFYEGGYRATSMESIAEELGVTKPFLYYHFENKHEILEQIAKQVVVLSRSVLEEDGQGLGPRDALVSRVRGYARIARTHRPLLLVLFREASSFSAATRALLASEEQAHIAQLAQLLAAGTQAGALRVELPLVTATAILGIVSGAELYGGGLDLPSVDVLEEHYALLALRMAGAP